MTVSRASVSALIVIRATSGMAVGVPVLIGLLGYLDTMGNAIRWKFIIDVVIVHTQKEILVRVGVEDMRVKISDAMLVHNLSRIWRSTHGHVGLCIQGQLFLSRI